jgi:hypothetical protein
MKTNFKVYPKKIHVYYKRQGGLCYAWSTHAYKRCKDAIAAAKAIHPDFQFVANFAKD